MWTVIDGKLTHTEIPEMISTFTPPYPCCMWYNDTNILRTSNTPDMIPLYVEPYPLGSWYVENGNLTSEKIPNQISLYTEPYPLYEWAVINGTLKMGIHPDIYEMGAFKNNPQLLTVEFPYETVNFGDYVFMDTPSLSEVLINIMSEYNEATTFDPNTVVYYKPIEYYFSDTIDNLTDEVISFGDAEVSAIPRIDGGNAKIRNRTPIDEL
jgi:hypothetical protein